MTSAPTPPPRPPAPWDRPLPVAEERDGVVVLRAVVYATEVGYRPLELDLYRPLPADRPLPFVVFLHGGAHLVGSRDELIPLYGLDPAPFERVARSGVAVASLSYRLSAEATYPAQLHDVAAGTRFLVARAAELGLDAARAAVWGSSAGAHLALLLALQQGDVTAVGSAGAPVALTPFSAVVDWCGPTDLNGPMGELPLPPPEPFTRLLGAPPATVPELAALASPVKQVRGPLGPTLVMHGTSDAVVPIRHSERMADALERAGTPVERVWYRGAGHEWTGSPDVAQAALDHTIAFLRAALAG